jgi:hypothetical protein
MAHGRLLIGSVLCAVCMLGHYIQPRKGKESVFTLKQKKREREREQSPAFLRGLYFYTLSCEDKGFTSKYIQNASKISFRANLRTLFSRVILIFLRENKLISFRASLTTAFSQRKLVHFLKGN